MGCLRYRYTRGTIAFPSVKVGSRDPGRFWLGGAECLSPDCWVECLSLSVPWIEGQALVGSNRGTGIRGSLIAAGWGDGLLEMSRLRYRYTWATIACPHVKVRSRDPGRFWLGGAECLSPDCWVECLSLSVSVPWIEGQALIGSNRGTGIRGSLIPGARGTDYWRWAAFDIVTRGRR